MYELPKSFGQSSPVLVRLERLGELLRKQDLPCCSCGYEADAVIALGSSEWLFCQRCLLDALLDAICFQTGGVRAGDTQLVAVATLPSAG